MAVRGIRGATTVASNTVEEILTATQELLAAIVTANNVNPEDVASAIFTVTPDLNAAFPARAAREFGWHHVPLLSAVEIETDGGPAPHRPHADPLEHRPPHLRCRHIYLRDAVQLRPDIGTEFTPLEPPPHEAPREQRQAAASRCSTPSRSRESPARTRRRRSSSTSARR